MSRTNIARCAGMSSHQQKQTLRVANVSAGGFEALVEADNPKGIRGHLWTCADPRVDGEQRLQAAIAAFYGRFGSPREITPTTNLEKGPTE